MMVGASSVSGVVAAKKTTANPAPSWGLHEPLSNCVACHDINAKGSSKFAVQVPQLCYTCHKEYLATDGWKHGPVATGDCLLCHEQHEAATRPLLKKPIPELCYHCHEPGMLGQIANHAKQSHTSCTDCHEAHASPGRMLLKQTYLKTDKGQSYMNKSSSARPRPTFVDRRGSLGELQGVSVMPMLNGSKSLNRYGVTEEFVRTKVEQHLRRHGVKILSDKEHDERESSLHVQLRLMEVTSMRRPGQIEGVSASINIYLRQTVELLAADRDGRKRFCAATTWDTGAIAIWGVSQVKEGFEEASKALVDRFGKDFLDANPRDSALTSNVQASATRP
jgi:predicted CXXCH cytochrome family protein